MLTGYLVVWLGVLFALMATALYTSSIRRVGRVEPPGKLARQEPRPPLEWNDPDPLLRWARRMFALAFLMILATEGVLQYALITGRYDLQYVFNFSERSLPLWYKIAGAWAGQEGSFLLWAIWTGVYGLLLMRSAGGYERWVMTVYSAIVLCLMGILAYQSPFAPLPPPPENAPFLRANFPPRDGIGLNASLENIWMTIHPPVIFSGFAALAVPFAYALAALWRNEYQEWVVRVRPWAIYAATMLGFGLALGGYWAYETLGWGGFWAWDPVENTSYFPWLFMAAALHGLMLQVNRGRMTRWNPLLCALPFLLFVYGTFLTRSGVLAEVSVHSFDALAKSALGILILMMGGGTLLTFGLWAWRYRQAAAFGGRGSRRADADSTELSTPLAGEQPQERPPKGFSREAAVRWGIILLIISALISLVGTSWPLITKLVRGQPVSLQPSFYNQMHTPWVAITAIVLAAAPMLRWHGMSLDDILQRLTKSWLMAVATGFVLYFLGFREPITLFVVVLLCFTAYANLGAIWRRVRASRVTVGGFLTHFGLAVGIIGLILSNAYEGKQQVVILQGQDTLAFGYRWRYLGMTGDAQQFGDPRFDKFNRVRIEVARHGEKFIAEPRFYLDRRRADNNSVVWPWIRRWWDHDLYVSFFAPPQVDASPLLAELREGENRQVGDYTLRFVDLRAEGSMGQEGFRAIARVQISKPGWKQPVEVEPFRLITQNGIVPVPVTLPDGAVLVIGGMDVGQRLVEFRLLMVPGHPETQPRWVIPLEVYYKPFTILVWLGPPLALIGGLLAAIRRARDGRFALAQLNAAPMPAPKPHRVRSHNGAARRPRTKQPLKFFSDPTMRSTPE
ncbi:Cytochrome c-type biogenesis protein CcmF [bacterium HR15]|nr:Cytochrome c-type biogenesis protein CcmF [bacterium HR15]